MSIFNTVKDRITTRDAAQLYGLKVSRNGMCRCPFHDDKNPSMKVDKRFHCFGCQADGDVIDFTSRLFGFNRKAACFKLAADFGISTDKSKEWSAPVKRYQLSEEQIVEHQAAYFIRELSDRQQLLTTWREVYQPKSPDEEWDPRFVEAVRTLPEVEMDLDQLISGDITEKRLVVQDLLKNREEVKPMNADAIPIYYENGAYARDHKELELFRSSHMENINCKKAIEDAIARNFDGIRLRKQAVTEVLDQYGADRVALVLAATVQIKHWDGRFSNQNKDWAFTVRMPESREDSAFDRRDAYAVTSHPAVLDGFISHARHEITERSKASIRDELKQSAISAAKSVPRLTEMER